MGAALSVFVLMSFSVFVIRVAAVALRLTGLSEASARFQALSAFSGTGFTTSEAEMIVNYPVRRRIISLLMVIGNLGLVTVFATVVVSLVETEGEFSAVMQQLAWLLAGLGILWFTVLNPAADRMMCSLISRFLKARTLLGEQSFQRLLQVSDEYSICEHCINKELLDENNKLRKVSLTELDLTVLGIRSQGKTHTAEEALDMAISEGDTLIVFGRESRHMALSWSV